MQQHDASMTPTDPSEAQKLSSNLTPRIHAHRKRSSTRLSKSRSHEPTKYGLHGQGSPHHGDHTIPFYIDIPRLPNETTVALAALQYLPTPVIVLDSLKTVLVANEAMGRLLGLRDKYQAEGGHEEEESVTDMLRGQSLSQIGCDLISDGVPMWVSWEKFLDNLATKPDDGSETELDGDNTPNSHIPNLHASENSKSRHRGRSPLRDRTLIHDTVVEVVISSHHGTHGQDSRNRHHKPRSSGNQTHCRMIISIWTLDDQRFFTLTFTSAAQAHKPHSHSHIVPRASTLSSSRSSQSSQPHTQGSSRSSSVVTSPSEVSLSSSVFPPTGPPAKCANPVAPAAMSEFQKITRMKDAMLGAMHIPVIAMWKDESVVFPNLAARRLLAVTADPTSDESYDFLSRFKAYTADFERELEDDENPIIKLCRTQKAFDKWEIGLINEKTGKKSIYDVSGYPVSDDKTGEFFAALCAFKDVTEYTEKLASQSEKSEQQFQLICNSMPQMLWTTRPDGFHDYFSQRWYDYTGLKPEECIGLGWVTPFHPDDMTETAMRWKHSLATGDEYLTEYRCKRYDGQWRWMLGRALPLRDTKTGKIVKWYGTCTDIQDVVDARTVGKRAREQLLEVLRHAEMTMWTINRDLVITFFEGDIGKGITAEELKERNTGLHITDAFKGLADEKFLVQFKGAVRRILDDKSPQEIYENSWDDGKWFRSRLLPLRGRRGPNGLMEEDYIDGVIGISTDVTKLKQQEQENIRLLANESAAKEASKMKSNFLANMSHEIRTPIAGVLGMSELLMDTALDKEQIDFASNIQRSANSLLTVINDILDFSKIESGRLDIEEVQFSLCVVLRDVAKMLSFAATKKKLEFISDIQLGEDGDLVLLGDPGRVRQILTNLLTNSIKFTSDGSVQMSARVLSTTSESTIIQFQVADTGIGIEEEVKKKLFRPFSQADSSTARRFGGTGLGLTISKNLVDLMHGTISLESKLDQGTLATFTIPFKKPEYTAGGTTPLVDIISLPDRLQSEMSLSCNHSSITSTSRIANGKSPPHSPTSIKTHRGSLPPGALSGPAIAAISDAQRGNFHILVVEDNPVNQQIALKFIRSLGFSVGAVWNGREALDYLLSCTTTKVNQPSKLLPSLILMDVQMPILDGYHATHILRHHAPYKSIKDIQDIPIVAMTASAIQGDREKCQRAGMDDYLAKPVKKTTLEKMILKWLGPGAERKSVLAASPTPDEAGGRPDLERVGTDHSSNCPGVDHMMAPSADFNVNASPPPVPVQTEEPILLPTPGAPGTPGSHVADLHAMSTTTSANPRHQTPTQTQAARRLSLSRTLLASQVPGVESEADRLVRRAEYEERAISLRDAKLIAATEPAHNSHAPGISAGSSLEKLNETGGGSTGPLGLAGSPLPMLKSYPDHGDTEGLVLRLTEENVGRLNAGLDPEGGHDTSSATMQALQRTEIHDANHNSNMSPASDIGTTGDADAEEEIAAASGQSGAEGGVMEGLVVGLPKLEVAGTGTGTGTETETRTLRPSWGQLRQSSEFSNVSSEGGSGITLRPAASKKEP